MNTKLQIFLLAAVVVFLFYLGMVFFNKAGANEFQVPKVDVCHCEGNECQTLHIAIPAAFFHVQQHENDYEGACQQPTPTPTLTPTVTLDPTVTASPSATPGEQPKTENITSDGLSDHRSDGLCSEPPCNKADFKPVVPSGPPSTGGGGQDHLPLENGSGK